MEIFERFYRFVEQITQQNKQILQTIAEIVQANGGSLESAHKIAYPIYVDGYADCRLLELFMLPKNVLALKLGDFEDDDTMVGPPFYLPAAQVCTQQLLQIVQLIVSENNRHEQLSKVVPGQ